MADGYSIQPEKSNVMSNSSAISNPVRIATFNIGLDEAREKGQLLKLLENGKHVQARKSAEIIQKVRPDILLINEIDGNDNEQVLRLYHEQYLGEQQNKNNPIHYPYHYMPDCNTGLDSGIHFTSSQDEGNPTDKFGFGHYDGQYCMAVLSMYPVDTQRIQRFQKLLWKDFPDAKLPVDPEKKTSWYTQEGLEHFRLSSKTHADVPIKLHDKTLHLLISHPTPPVFDGAEDRNGRRNFDEILFWKHYINGETNWLTNDAGKPVSGLNGDQRFVIMGDLNASTVEGDATEFAVQDSQYKQRAITLLLEDERVAKGFSETQNNLKIPTSFGGNENAPDNLWSKFHTAGWKMRADYVVPSAWGIKIIGSGVFWPGTTDKDAALVNDTETGKSSSDHRLVWLDVLLTED